MKVQIVIPVINLWHKYTLPCINSVTRACEGLDYRILLIDNKSDDETLREAGKLVSDRFSHKRNEDRWSCAKSWNYGVQDAIERGADYIFIINNDILLHPLAIKNLMGRFQRRFLPVGTESIEPTDVIEIGESDPENLSLVSCLDMRGEIEPHDIFFYPENEKLSVEESEHPNFSAFMITKESYEKIGPFDESFRPAYFEDNDYHYRINLKECKAICLPTALFYHFGSGTQKQDPLKPVVSNESFEANRQYYTNKWGGGPGKETYKTPFNK